MSPRFHVTTMLLVGVIWGVLLFLNGVTVELEWLKPASTVAGILTFMFIVFDRWVWRWKWLKWFVKRPHVWGTWRVVLRSNYRKPGSKGPISPIEGYMTIWQVYSDIRVRLFTAESSSESVAVQRFAKTDGTCELAVIYENFPNQSVRKQSPIHFGAMILTVEESPESRLAGHYWTDRESGGEIEVTDRRKVMYWSYFAATKAFK